MFKSFMTMNALASVAMLASGIVYAQNYPIKPVRMMSNSAGGGGDIAARLISQGLSTGLGQQVVVEPRGSLGGAIAGEMLAKAAPDGYTLLFYSNTIWLAPLMREKPTYDPLRDFSPLTLVSMTPNLLVVHPSLPVKTARELIALAKAKPGELNYGMSGIGSTSHIAAELFKSMAGVDIVSVNYKGTAPAFTDVVAGNIQLAFGSSAPLSAHIKSGRLRALGVTSAQPSVLAPGLPTVATTGLPGYESVSMYGMFAPVRTPDAIVKRLNHEVVQVLNQADVKEKFLNTGSETVGSTPEQFAATMKAEIVRMGKVIRDAGIKAE